MSAFGISSFLSVVFLLRVLSFTLPMADRSAWKVGLVSQKCWVSVLSSGDGLLSVPVGHAVCCPCGDGDRFLMQVQCC